jgi:acyl-CoA synthetase (AMP-forming)/AMP-acid ligase II
VVWNLSQLFEAVAAVVPDREAIVCGARRLTYRQLDERANRLAHHLTSVGIGAGDHIAVALYNSTEYLETMLAAFKLAAVPVNVNYRYLADELHYLLDDAGVRAVVHERELGGMVTTTRLPRIRHTLCRGDAYEQALAAAEPGPAGAPDRSADDLYILYTGGTTGAPKGVMWRHEDIFFAALGGTADLVGLDRGPDEAKFAERARKGRGRTLPACPFIHGTAHWMALSTLFGGGTVIVAPDRQYDAPRLLSLLESERVSFLVIVGDAFARPLVEALERDPTGWDLKSLSVVLSGGAILSPALKERLTALLPSAIIVDGYGTSETGGQGSMVTAAGAPAGRLRFKANAETAVLDDACHPVAPGSGRVGRLARRGHIPLGYFKDPDKTAVTFPVVDGVRWAIPGDMAEVDEDGTIILHGRGAMSINTGGEKVFPEEVESVLKEHPAVLDAVVVGLPSERWGEEVVAVVEVSGRADCEAIGRHCRQRLAGYKVPRSYVVVDAVQRSAAGKADYHWARATAARRT